MLEHLNGDEKIPRRVVIVGAQGFVGGAVARVASKRGIQVLRLGRGDVDLLSSNAGLALAGALEPDDALVAAAAIAPVRDIAMLQQNLTIISAIATAIESSSLSHIVNIGSDAVYVDSPRPLNEDSGLGPGSLHGIMHLTRELVLNEAAGDVPFATLRPTLIYGLDDPHNGYGPNRFRRLAGAGEDIVLFGEGEERRDHISVEDVAELSVRMLMRRSVGALNAATGTVMSFRDIAELIAATSGGIVKVTNTPRSGPMPHNGYRPFEAAATAEAFPEFRYTPIKDGLVEIQEKING